MLPLMRKATAQIEYHYDLADAAYCSDAIRTESYLLGHKALIEHNPRRGEKIHFGPKESEIYKARNCVERVNAHLKDSHIGTNIGVKGYEKIFTHFMFGILAITV